MKVEKPSNFCRLIGSNVKMQLSEKRNTQIEFGTMMLHFFSGANRSTFVRFDSNRAKLSLPSNVM